jgi:hypothetical protein
MRYSDFVAFFNVVSNSLGSIYSWIGGQVEVVCKAIFYPMLAPFFLPINSFLGKFYQPYVSICAVGLFVCTMIWVGLILNKDYVNRGRPYKSLWSDLRLWTVISMTPHVLVYFYFR